ncbi:cation:proton antiporter [Thermosulfuriphilus sp.]
MSEYVLIGLSAIVGLGVAAQWVAWRFRLPSILLLLVLGLLAGPVFGFLDPQGLLGEALLPLVSLSVAIILFEGGLSLRLSEIRHTAQTIGRLVTLGAIISWSLTFVAARFILGLSWSVALLLGAILVVTGPTVIQPLLKHIRPTGRVASVLKWEGIVIDPLGAMLAVLVFQAITAAEASQVPWGALLGALKTFFLGGSVGAGCAAALVLILRRYWIPDFLENALILMMVIGAFTFSNQLQPESGLLAVTIMGIFLANQGAVSIRHVVEFKENLRTLLISSLFIILAARLRLEELLQISRANVFFLSTVVVLVRPLSVLAATFFSELNWRERAFLSFMAPRGIVAAAVASIFSLELSKSGFVDGRYLVPIVFQVIAVTVALYGLFSPLVARLLKVAQPDPQGVLFVGAHAFSRHLAAALEEEGIKCLLVDTNWVNIVEARQMGLSTFYSSILSGCVLDEIGLEGLGRLFAMTSNDEVNSLAVIHFVDVFGRAEVYQLPPGGYGFGCPEPVSLHLRGRLLFNKEATYFRVMSRLAQGARIKKGRVEKAFKLPKGAWPLAIITRAGKLQVFTVDSRPEPKLGQVLIWLED